MQHWPNLCWLCAQFSYLCCSQFEMVSGKFELSEEITSHQLVEGKYRLAPLYKVSPVTRNWVPRRSSHKFNLDPWATLFLVIDWVSGNRSSWTLSWCATWAWWRGRGRPSSQTATRTSRTSWTPGGPSTSRKTKTPTWWWTSRTCRVRHLNIQYHVHMIDFNLMQVCFSRRRDWWGRTCMFAMTGDRSQVSSGLGRVYVCCVRSLHKFWVVVINSVYKWVSFCEKKYYVSKNLSLASRICVRIMGLIRKNCGKSWSSFKLITIEFWNFWQDSEIISK